MAWTYQSISRQNVNTIYRSVTFGRTIYLSFVKICFIWDLTNFSNGNWRRENELAEERKFHVVGLSRRYHSGIPALTLLSSHNNARIPFVLPTSLVNKVHTTVLHSSESFRSMYLWSPAHARRWSVASNLNSYPVGSCDFLLEWQIRC